VTSCGDNANPYGGAHAAWGTEARGAVAAWRGSGVVGGTRRWQRVGLQRPKLSGIDPLGTARKLPMRKKKSDSY
jgi:hypothetical protein